METFTPIVISSKRAKRHIETIKARHADILANLEEHKKKVESYHQQKAVEQQVKMQQLAEQRKMQMEQEMKSRTQMLAHHKEMAAHQNKAAELEIKKQALAK